ncbi:MAG: hypothetical protein WCK58_00970 [Chloroflexota bacterium]
MHVARASIRKVILPFAMLAVVSAAVVPVASAAAPRRVVAGPAFGFTLPRGAGGLAQPQTAARRSANMTYHGGKIMATAVTKTFFRGTSWATYAGDKITGLDTWYSGFSGSHYQGTVLEYTDSTGAHAGSSPTTHQGHYVDTAAETSKGSTNAVLAEISAMVTASGTVIDPNGNSYFALYSDQKRGNAGYCAWHSAGTIGGKAVQFAFFWNLDGDAGCDPADTSGLHSQGLAALANVTGHELAEAMSDPASPGAWYDGSGAENGDKCAWTFGGPLATFSNGSAWKVQGEWSNAAFTAGTGYANSSGQKGCVGGL